MHIFNESFVYSFIQQVFAATQTPGEAGKNWFQGTADAVRQFIWVFEVRIGLVPNILENKIKVCIWSWGTLSTLGFNGNIRIAGGC